MMKRKNIIIGPETEAFLSARGPVSEANRVALTRYQALLGQGGCLAAARFSDAHLWVLVSFFADYKTSTLGYADLGHLAAIAPVELLSFWGLDRGRFAQEVREASATERTALLDMVERFWRCGLQERTDRGLPRRLLIGEAEGGGPDA